VLWVLKADDKAFSSDEEFYHNIVKPHLEQGKSFIIVLNQVDKVHPYREWDIQNCKPGQEQQNNINAKIKLVAEKFGVDSKIVVPVSCTDKYNLITLVETIIFAIPKEKKITFLNSVKHEHRSEKAKVEAKRGFWESVSEYFTGSDFGKSLDTLFGKDPLVNVLDLISKRIFSWW